VVDEDEVEGPFQARQRRRGVLAEEPDVFGEPGLLQVGLGLLVSELALGGMTFGWGRPGGRFDAIQAPAAEADRIIGVALDRGINLIDTANIYGDGGSEEIIGRALEGRRDRVVVATKVRGPMGPSPEDKGLSRRHIIAACEASLRRLRISTIDLYQVHYPDPATPIEETLSALHALVRAGKVRHVGACNFGSYLTTKALWISDRFGLARLATLQQQYSLVVRAIEEEILPLCLAEDLGVLAFSPLAHGFLSGKYRRGEPPPPASRLAQFTHVLERHDVDRDWAVVDEVRRVAAELGTTPSRVAHAWVMAQPGVSSVIVGARTVAHLEDSLGAAELDLPAEAMARLDQLSRIPLRYPFGGQRRPD